MKRADDAFTRNVYLFCPLLCDECINRQPTALCAALTQMAPTGAVSEPQPQLEADCRVDVAARMPGPAEPTSVRLYVNTEPRVRWKSVPLRTP